MEHAELERFKRILETTLQNMEQPLRRRDEIAVENAPDTLDRVQRAADRELAIRQIESSFSRMQSLKLALDRIEDGSYGTCMRCEQDISPKRLQAVPWASYCIRCQDIADRERAEPEGEGVELLMRMRDVA
jgi:RNA polymerase-binding transcription factor